MTTLAAQTSEVISFGPFQPGRERPAVDIEKVPKGHGCLPDCVGATAALPWIAADLLHRQISAALATRRPRGRRDAGGAV